MTEPEAPKQHQWNIGDKGNKPICAIVVGMAGSGKTSLMQRLNSYLNEKSLSRYFINLDPAVLNVPFATNVDIRDSLNYKDVMKNYSLGPNGAILTALNLFVTKFDQVMDLIDKRAPELHYVMMDTPGQIEVFNWSASGTIISEALSSTYPTVYLFVVDTPQCTNPRTFMSNMLYACSLFYKSKLPMVLCFTKTDITQHEFALQWMEEPDEFEDACRGDDSYMSTFTQSCSLMLGEFYQHFPCVGVSSVTGSGIPELLEKLREVAEIRTNDGDTSSEVETPNDVETAADELGILS